jgi:hypothetical protein
MFAEPGLMGAGQVGCEFAPQLRDKLFLPHQMLPALRSGMPGYIGVRLTESGLHQCDGMPPLLRAMGQTFNERLPLMVQSFHFVMQSSHIVRQNTHFHSPLTRSLPF